MKPQLQKFLSLLMAFVLAFSLVPAVLADNSTDSSPDSSPGSDAVDTGTGTDDPENIPQEAITVEVGEYKRCDIPSGGDTTDKVEKWESDKPDVASVDSKGIVHGEKEGSAVITAISKDGKVLKAFNVTVVAKVEEPELSISLPKTASVEEGKTVQLKATITPEDTKITWTSRDESIATVKNGVVTGVKAGTVEIVAMVGTGDKIETASCSVEVTPKKVETKITLDRSSVTLDIGSTIDKKSGVLSATITPKPELGDKTTLNWTVESTNNCIDIFATEKLNTCLITAKKEGTAVITVTYGTGNAAPKATCKVTVNDSSKVTAKLSLSYSPASSNVTLSYSNSSYYDYRKLSVTPSVKQGDKDVTSSYNFSYQWTKENSNLSNSDYYSYTVYADDLASYNRDYTYTCYVTATKKNSVTDSSLPDKLTGNRSWNVRRDDDRYDTDFDVSCTVYDTSDGYALGDKDDKGKSSVLSQIEDFVERQRGSSSRYDDLDYVKFTNPGSSSSSVGYLDVSSSTKCYADQKPYLSDVEFIPKKTGTAKFDFTAYGERGTYYGTLTVKVVEGDSKTGGNIKYSARAGEDVQFDADDFEDWWEDMYSRGTLKYVEFTSVSSGDLYADYRSSSDKGTDVVSSRSPESCYVRPSSRQTGIDDLTFVPRGTSTSTVTIRFTGYGTTSSSSSSENSRSGTVTISYSNTSATAKSIDYSTTGTTAISLSTSDFTSRYRDVVGSSAGTLTIRFRSVPSNGTLSHNGTTLTSSNIRNYDFSSSSTGSYRINSVTYTPKSSTSTYTDKVEYDCYTGSTFRFSGTINFTVKPAVVPVVDNVTISYNSTGSGVNFNASDFYNANSALLTCSYLTFGTPSSGKLYVGSTAVSTSDKFSYFSGNSSYRNLSGITYRPASGFNGTATVSFTAYNSDNTKAVSGTVRITVTQPGAATTNPSSFSDVPNNSSTAWYYTAVTQLAAANIINGRSDGKFHPSDNVTYGEALKLVLLAAGYPQQTELSGANWAANYLNLAISNSILPGSASDYTLSKAINRLTVASVAAKAMKLSPVTDTSSSPYSDTKDGYVLALTNLGILQGDKSSGSLRFRGGDTLTRAELSVIIYRIYNYRSNPNNNTPVVDTNKPGWLN